MYEGPKDVCVVVECGGKISLSQGEEGHALCNLDSPAMASEEFIKISHHKEQLPEVVPNHGGGVIDLQAAKSGRTNHGIAEGTVEQRAAMIDKIEAPHVPKAVLSHQR